MKRPLFPDGFLINAHHSHPSARQEEPPPSFLSPNALQPAPLPMARGQVEGPSGWEDAKNSVDREWLPLLSPAWHLRGEPSTCWRAAVCTSRSRSQACPLGAPGADPGPSLFQSFLPSSVRTSWPKPEQRARVSRFLCVSDSPGSAALSAEELFNFPVSLSRSNPILPERAHVNAGTGADVGGAAGMMCLVGSAGPRAVLP